MMQRAVMQINTPDVVRPGLITGCGCLACKASKEAAAQSVHYLRVSWLMKSGNWSPFISICWPACRLQWLAMLIICHLLVRTSFSLNRLNSHHLLTPTRPSCLVKSFFYMHVQLHCKLFRYLHSTRSPEITGFYENALGEWVLGQGWTCCRPRCQGKCWHLKTVAVASSDQATLEMCFQLEKRICDSFC